MLPGESAPNLARGRAALQPGLAQQALDDFGRALTVDPRNIEIFSNRALLEVSAGQYAKAIADLDRVIALRPRLAHDFVLVRG
jgi:tetratricopeptide (TPR) repeat protein